MLLRWQHGVHTSQDATLSPGYGHASAMTITQKNPACARRRGRSGRADGLSADLFAISCGAHRLATLRPHCRHDCAAAGALASQRVAIGRHKVSAEAAGHTSRIANVHKCSCARSHAVLSCSVRAHGGKTADGTVQRRTNDQEVLEQLLLPPCPAKFVLGLTCPLLLQPQRCGIVASMLRSSSLSGYDVGCRHVSCVCLLTIKACLGALLTCSNQL